MKSLMALLKPFKCHYKVCLHFVDPLAVKSFTCNEVAVTAGTDVVAAVQCCFISGLYLTYDCKRSLVEDHLY